MIKFISIVLIFLIASFHLNAETVFEPKKNNEAIKNELNKISWFNLRIPEEQFTSIHQDERNFKLKAHKHMAHTTLLLATGSVVTSIMAKKEIDKNRNNRNGQFHADDAKELNLHMAIASATLLSYYTTAYFAISAPKSESMIDPENIKWHKGLSYIHMTGMILAPILGVMAYKDYKDAKNPEGIAKLHKPLMSISTLALFAAAYTISF